MKIQAIEIENFVGIADGRYPIGTLTRVSGRNGAGKTSLGRALAYALTGLRPDGSAAADDYRADPAKPMQVTIEADGTILRRKRTKSAGSISVDGLPQTNEQLASAWHMTPLAMLIQTWPGAWFSLSEAKQREMILSVLPAPDMRAVYEKTTGASADGIDFSQSAAALHAAWTQKRLALEKEGAKVAGQLEEIKKQLATASETLGDPDELEETATAAAKALEAAEERLRIATESRRAWDRYANDRAEWTRRCETLQCTGRVLNKTCPTCGQPWPQSEPPPPPTMPPEPAAPTVPEVALADLLDAQREANALARARREAEAAHRVALESQSSIEINERKERLETLLVDLRSQYAVAKAAEVAIHPKTGIWAEALRAQLSLVTLDGYEFDTADDGFRVRIARTGVPVAAASSGERIKFCLALSAFIADLCQPPLRVVFVEHADLLDAVPRLGGFQLVGERVAKTGDFAVEVVVP